MSAMIFSKRLAVKYERRGLEEGIETSNFWFGYGATDQNTDLEVAERFSLGVMRMDKIWTNTSEGQHRSDVLETNLERPD